VANFICARGEKIKLYFYHSSKINRDIATRRHDRHHLSGTLEELAGNIAWDGTARAYIGSDVEIASF
jgi:hypothetical protein